MHVITFTFRTVTVGHCYVDRKLAFFPKKNSESPGHQGPPYVTAIFSWYE